MRDSRGIAICLNNLCVLAHDQGQYDAARRLYEESLKVSREVGAPRGVAQALKNLGWLAVHDGEYEAARSLFDESLSISRQLGDRFGLASTLTSLELSQLSRATTEQLGACSRTAWQPHETWETRCS